MEDCSIELVIHKLANMIIASCCKTTYASSVLSRRKLGAVIFLLHYAKRYNMDKYESYAMELLEYIKDNLVISNNKNVVNHNLIDIGIGMNYIVSQDLAMGDLDDALEEADNFLLSYLDDKNILYLTHRDLTAIGKYFLLRMDATPSSASHLHHIKALNRIIELLELHVFNIPICNPAIVKFLYLSSKVLSDKSSTESLLIQQLNNYPNQTNWYRSGIPHWFSAFFIPKDNEPLRKIIIQEIEKYLYYDRSDVIAGGTSGLIVWMNLLHDDLSLPEGNYSAIKNAAIETIVSNINNYKVPMDVSLYFGCSGIGLALLSCIDSKCNQWIKLL